MPTEERFVGLERSEVVAGKKQLLYSEMEILTSLQKYSEYKKFRKEELALKNLLKKVINDMKKEMEILSGLIPHIKIAEPESPEAVKSIALTKRDSLEEEIQKIRKKISLLSAN